MNFAEIVEIENGNSVIYGIQLDGKMLGFEYFQLDLATWKRNEINKTLIESKISDSNTKIRYNVDSFGVTEYIAVGKYESSDPHEIVRYLKSRNLLKEGME